MKRFLRVIILVFGLALLISTALIALHRDDEPDIWLTEFAHDPNLLSGDLNYDKNRYQVRMLPTGRAVSSQVPRTHTQPVDGVLSPSGEWVVRAENVDGYPRIIRTNMDGTDPIVLSFLDADTEVEDLVWSPDNQWIVTEFNRTKDAQGLLLMRADGSQSRILGEIGDHRDPIWSSDNNWVIFTTYFFNREVDVGSSLSRIRVDGTGLERFADDLFHFNDALSPDGEWLYFQGAIDGNPPFQILRVAVGDSDVQQLTTLQHDIIHYSLSPDGQKILLIAFDGVDLEFYLMRSDGSQVKKLRGYVPLSTQVDWAYDLLRNSISWSPDGRLVSFFSIGSSFELYQASFDTDHLMHLYSLKYARIPITAPEYVLMKNRRIDAWFLMMMAGLLVIGGLKMPEAWLN